MIRVFALWTVDIAVQGNVRIPLQRDSEGQWLAHARLASSGIVVDPLVIHASEATTLFLDTLPRSARNIQVVFNTTRDGESYNLTIPSDCATVGDATSFIGIAPNSALTQSAGAVALVRQGDDAANLVIGLSIDEFNETCVPGTLIQFQTSSWSMFEGYFSFANEAMEAVYSMQMINPPTSLTSFLTLNTWMVYYLIGKMQEMGGIRIESTLSFANCTNIDNMPTIELSLLTTSSGYSTIAYYPEDYIQMNSNETCRLLIAQPVMGTEFNPLRIPQTNVRISSNGTWGICDAI